MYTAGNIEDFFKDHKEDLHGVADLARKVKAKIAALDPFIQQHTSAVCPGCRRICCINRHAYYECDDLIYLYALGVKPHTFEQRADEEPCQFLTPSGCKLNRTIRPSGCNWYFCSRLFDSMERSPGTAYADFDRSLQELADLWIELGAEFRMRFRAIKGYEVG